MTEEMVQLVCPHCKTLQKPVPYGTKEMRCENCSTRFSVGYVDREVAALQKQVNDLREAGVDKAKLEGMTRTVERLQESLRSVEHFRPSFALKRVMYVPEDSVNNLNEADLEFGIVLSVLSLFVGLMLEHYFNKVGSLLLLTTVLVGGYTVYAGRKAYKLKQQLKEDMSNNQYPLSLIRPEGSDSTGSE